MAETLHEIRARKGFYVYYYRRAVKGLWAALILILLLIAAILLLKASRTEPEAYATSSDGILIAIPVFERPPYKLTETLQ